MQFNSYSGSGRTLMVKFTCQRCKKEQIDLLEDHRNDDKESYGFLHNIKPPKDWKELLHGPLLCPKCFAAYKNFMENKEVE